MDTLTYQNIDNRLTLPDTPSFWTIQNGGRELARMDSKGNLTFADNLTLEEAKEAVRIALGVIAKKG